MIWYTIYPDNVTAHMERVDGAEYTSFAVYDSKGVFICGGGYPTAWECDSTIRDFLGLPPVIIEDAAVS